MNLPHEQQTGQSVECRESTKQSQISFWQIARLSLKGQKVDCTSMPLNHAVLMLAVPMVLEMAMESLFAIVDVFWVSRLGPDAIAVVGLTESIMTLMYSVAVGMSFAATAIIARRMGEGDPERAGHAAGQILLLGAAISVCLGLVLGYFGPDILGLMGASDAVIVLGTDFVRIMLGGNLSVFIIFLINAIFRGAGDAVLAMRSLWLANAINIALGPLLIFGYGPFPDMGVTGAAVATNIGRAAGVVYQLWYLMGAQSRIAISMRHMVPVIADMRTILWRSSGGIMQLMISTTSWIGLMKILATFGSAALAGFTIAMRIVVVALMPAAGLANAGATMVGQNLGAKAPERAEKSIWIAMRFTVIFLGALGLFLALLADALIGLFSNELLIREYGGSALWVVSLGLPLVAVSLCFEAAFNGAGDPWTPARLNFFCFWLGQIPLAWVLAVGFKLGPAGVFISLPLSFMALALWGLILFKRGYWKSQSI